MTILLNIMTDNNFTWRWYEKMG